MDHVTTFKPPSSKCRIMIANCLPRDVRKVEALLVRCAGPYFDLVAFESSQPRATRNSIDSDSHHGDGRRSNRIVESKLLLAVTFFTLNQAAKAIKNINGTKLSGERLQVFKSRPRTQRYEGSLPFPKMIELANFLFGASGWSSQVISLAHTDPEKETQTPTPASPEAISSSRCWCAVVHLRFGSSVRIVFGSQDAEYDQQGDQVVSGEGLGWESKEEDSRYRHQGASKRAVSNAIRNAFEKLSVVESRKGLICVI